MLPTLAQFCRWDFLGWFFQAFSLGIPTFAQLQTLHFQTFFTSILEYVGEISGFCKMLLNFAKMLIKFAIFRRDFHGFLPDLREIPEIDGYQRIIFPLCLVFPLLLHQAFSKMSRKSLKFNLHYFYESLTIDLDKIIITLNY